MVNALLSRRGVQGVEGVGLMALDGSLIIMMGIMRLRHALARGEQNHEFQLFSMRLKRSGRRTQIYFVPEAEDQLAGGETRPMASSSCMFYNLITYDTSSDRNNCLPKPSVMD